MSALVLRRLTAAEADAALLHAWRDDPHSRAMSLDPRPIGWDEHAAWVRRLLADPDRLQLLAEEGAGGPVGAIRFDRDGREAVVSVVVAPAARGRGLARRLVAVAEAQARRLGSDAVALEVRADNRAARALYARLGYVEVARLPEYYEDGAAGLRLVKRLRR